MSITNTPVVNPSPKARFQESTDNVSRHRTLVDSKEFQRAIDFALLQFGLALATQPLSQEEFQIGAAGLKLRGVHDFISILRNLSETPKPLAIVNRNDNLNHQI